MSEALEAYRPGRVIAGRYRITSPLSQGGMGAVYLAQQVSLGRDVALKVILERGTDPELIKRFDVEARAVCQLKHPNIITYHDYGRDDDGHPYLVMEYLAGYPGTKLVYGERRPGLLDLVHVVAQVCSALSEAHDKGIIHRDLKWSNVMICPQSHDPYFAKLIDFGIMKVATDGSSGDQRALTRTGMLLGTPEYMSPEAICGMPIDGRADQYSLAIMLWEALEGQRPFDANSHFELLRQQVQDEPPPFSNAAELMATYPEVEAVILRGMEKHPSDRFDDIIAFQQALMAACGLITPAVTAPARPAVRTKPRGRGVTAAIGSSGARLPAAPLTGPRPVDTAVKTGDPRAERAPWRPHWSLLAAGFLVFVAIGFGVMLALIGDRGERGDAADPGALAARAALANEHVAREDATEPVVEAMDVAAAAADAPAPEDTRARAIAAKSEIEANGDREIAGSAEVVAAVAPTGNEAGGGARDEAAARKDEAAVPEDDQGDAAAPGSDKDRGTTREDEAAGTAAEEPVATPKPVAPRAPGRVFIQVDPWGDVAIDGRAVGRAPFEGELKPGTHSVTVTNTFFKGSYSFRIKVESGKRIARTIVLEKHLEKVD